jgi:Calcineurin-like phosphoesterase
MRNALFEPNRFGRDFVCGDLHGQLFLLEKFLEEINFDKNADRMFSVGDLIDRGEDSLGCLRLLNEQWFHAVKGNHEQLMQDAFASGNKGLDFLWGMNGGNWIRTVRPQDVQEIEDRYLPIVRSLPLCITVKLETGRKFHVIHAEILGEENETITDENLIDPEKFEDIARRFCPNEGGHGLIWARDMFGDIYGQTVTALHAELLKNAHRKNHVTDFFNNKLSHIFSGHTPMIDPTTIMGQTNLDTLAFGVDKKDWAGLTIAEPLTGRFWKTKPGSVTQVQPRII